MSGASGAERITNRRDLGRAGPGWIIGFVGAALAFVATLVPFSGGAKLVEFSNPLSSFSDTLVWWAPTIAAAVVVIVTTVRTTPPWVSGILTGLGAAMILNFLAILVVAATNGPPPYLGIVGSAAILAAGVLGSLRGAAPSAG